MKGLVLRHYLKRSLTEPVGILIVTGLPVILIVILTMVLMEQMPEAIRPYLDMLDYNPVATHIAILFMISFQFFGGNVLLDYINHDFRGDRRWRMFAMPVRSNDYIFGTLVACVIYCIVQGILVIAITGLFLDVYWGNPFVLIGTLIACAILSQLIWMLLFLVFPKKGTVEAAGQIVTWGMMIASGWIGMSVADGDVTVSGGGAFENFLTRYGTPISLARNAITDSGVGNDMSHALFNLGILYAVIVVFAVIVLLVGKNKGFSPAKSAVAASSASNPDKKLLRAKANSVPKIHDVADITKQRDLELSAPSGHGGAFTVYKYALLRGVRNPLSLALNAVLPIVVLLFPAVWAEDFPMGFSLIGVALMYGAFVAARGILNDKLDGTITRILSSRVSSLRYLVQNLMAAMTPLTIQILLIGLLGTVLRGWDADFALSAMLLLFLFAAASVSLSFAWSCLFKEKETSYAMFSVLMSVVAMLGGFFIPLQIIPDVLRFIGAFFPAFWLSNGILDLQGGNAMGTFWISALVIFLFSVLYLVFGSKRRMI